MGTLQTFFAHENVRNIVLCMPVKLLIYTVAWAHDANAQTNLYFKNAASPICPK